VAKRSDGLVKPREKLNRLSVPLETEELLVQEQWKELKIRVKREENDDRTRVKKCRQAT